jgi:phosphocarrier protein
MTQPLPALTVSRSIRVLDDLGLHARPAARVVQTARRFQSQVTLSLGGASADAKSILDILFLSAPRGSSLTLICTGSDALQAAEALSGIFQNPLSGEGS